MKKLLIIIPLVGVVAGLVYAFYHQEEIEGWWAEYVDVKGRANNLFVDTRKAAMRLVSR